MRRDLSMTTVSAPESASKTTFDLGPARALSCRECGHQVPLAAEFACVECFGPLEVVYDFDRVRREDIESGPRSIWRYRGLLPVPSTVDAYPNTEPGGNRLRRADPLARALRVKRAAGP